MVDSCRRRPLIVKLLLCKILICKLTLKVRFPPIPKPTLRSLFSLQPTQCAILLQVYSLSHVPESYFWIAEAIKSRRNALSTLLRYEHQRCESFRMHISCCSRSVLFQNVGRVEAREDATPHQRLEVASRLLGVQLCRAEIVRAACPLGDFSLAFRSFSRLSLIFSRCICFRPRSWRKLEPSMKS